MRRRLSQQPTLVDETEQQDPPGLVEDQQPCVEDGETLDQAALRELVEDTGLRREDVGPEVARREVALPLPDGEHVMQDVRYFVVRVADNALSRDDWTELEREIMVEHRWWSLDERSCTEANLREMIEAKA